jgi:hypothetical protein
MIHYVEATFGEISFLEIFADSELEKEIVRGVLEKISVPYTEIGGDIATNQFSRRREIEKAVSEVKDLKISKECGTFKEVIF